jgi:response regulator RpfG family c-di-GMP phosphodiesterase
MSLLPSNSPSNRARHSESDGHELLLVGGAYTSSHALRDLILRAGGIQVNLCARVNDAVDVAIHICPTVILLDLREVGFDGLGILESFKRSPEVGAVPIIMLTTQETTTIRDEAFSRGISDFVVFPISTTELIARIRTHSTGYLNVLKRNRSTTAYETLQSELRTVHRALEESRSHVSTPNDQQEDTLWKSRVGGLVKIGIELNQIQDFDSLMDRILSEARFLLHSQAGTIFLRDGDTLRFAFFHNDALAERTSTGDPPPVPTFRIPITDRSLAGWVCLTGQPLHVTDCYNIPLEVPYRFDSSFDLLLGYRTQSMIAMPLKNQSGKILGVIQVINPLSPDGRVITGYSSDDIRLLEHFASVATVAIERAHTTDRMVSGFIRMIEMRDPDETFPHSERVGGYAAVLFEEWARRRGLVGAAFNRQLARLMYAAKLHDCGKIGVSDSILNSPHSLSDAERKEIQKHTHKGGKIFPRDSTDFDEAAHEVALFHHERWNGEGYPGFDDGGVHRGRCGEEIPLFARIVGLADVFDALSSDRCYRDAWKADKVLEHIQDQKGKHFDPELVDIFFAKLDEIYRVRDSNPDLS